jgi:hypothetical protein
MHIYQQKPASHWMVLRRAAAPSTLWWAVDLKEKVKKRRPAGRRSGRSLEMLPAVRTLISRRTEAKIVDQPSDAAFNVVADGTDG